MDIVEQAIAALSTKLRERPTEYTRNPADSRNLVRLRLSDSPHELFACLYFDTRNGLLAFEVPFTGTIDGASVHPRVIVQRALELNAAAVILAHNHPSGDSTPSQSDVRLTRRLQEALQLIDVRVLDHLIVGGTRDMTITSMAEQGLF